MMRDYLCNALIIFLETIFIGTGIASTSIYILLVRRTESLTGIMCRALSSFFSSDIKYIEAEAIGIPVEVKKDTHQHKGSIG